MRWCIPFLFLLTFSGMAYGLGIEGTNPLPNTELFLPSDTLWIVFDGPAAGITANDIFIHGRQAAYGIGWLDVQDRVVRVRPFLPFFVGDRVTVTIHSSLLPPYAFSFWVRAPLGLFPAPDGWIFSQDLRYGSVPCAMALADFDNDGALDIAALFRDRVGVARSRLFDGGGVLFHPTMLSWSFPETAGDERRVIRCGDLNSDGRMDIVTLTHATSTLNLYRNESAPQNIQFGVEESFPLPVTHPADFRLADVSGDGKLDLLVIGSYPQTDSLIILLNTTTSQQDIQFGQRRGVWVSNGPSALDVADLDLNHSLDIVVSCIAAQSIDILFGDTLDPLQYDRVTVLGGTALPAGPDGFVIGNIFRQFVDDRGELLDLAVWSSGSHAGNLGSGRRALDENPYLYLFENSGNRTFVTAPNPFPNWPNDAQVLSVTCADLDRSSALPGGDRDWVIAGILQADSSLFWYDQDRNPVSPVPFELPRPFLTEAGDLDLDGDLDLVVIDLREGDERIVYFMNPDSPPGPSDTLDFGLVPIDGRTDTSGFYYVNQDLYPRTLVNVNTQSLHPVYDFLGVFAPGGQTPETLPRRIEIGETIELRFRFRPQDWVWYPSSVRLEFLGDLGGSLSRTIVISGEGGRSWLGMMELPPVTTHSTLWLGYVEPDSTLDTLFWYRNHGNYPLDVRIRSLTPPFVADTDSETIIPRNRGRFRSLVFHAPSSTTGWFTDTLIARDSLFQWADSTTFPRNLAIADSDTIVVTACVLVNQLPDMACPPTVNEGETGTFHLDVADPNDQSGDSLWCMYLGHTTGTSLSIDTLPDLQPVLRDSFHLPYTVSDSVPPGGEICTLRFELRDRQFPERFVLKECPVVINAIDDSPVIHASEMIEIPELADLRNRPLAYVTDEERDRLDGRTHPLSGYLYPPVAGRYDTISNRFFIDWIPDYGSAGLYGLGLVAWEKQDAASRDSSAVLIHVLDSLPDPRVESLTLSASTVDRNQNVWIRYAIANPAGCPVEFPFRVYVIHEPPSGTWDTLCTDDFSQGFPAGGIVRDSCDSPSLGVCGTNCFRVALTGFNAAGNDYNPSNNSATACASVRCPELKAVSISAPAQVRKYQPFDITALVAEINGITVDSEFRTLIRDGSVPILDTMIASVAGGDTVELDASWQTGVLGDHSLCLEIFPPPNQDGNAQNNYVCMDVTVIGDPFHVHPLPFTPNGDGINDTLWFDFGDERYNSPEVNVFDLNGRHLVRLDRVDGENKAIPWNGRDRTSADCVPGAYFYTFSAGGKKVASGLVYIAR